MMKVPIDYSKLKGRIVEKCGSQRSFAAKMGLSERTISLKLSGRVPFTQSDILKALQVLDLTHADIQGYFFVVKVQNF